MKSHTLPFQRPAGASKDIDSTTKISISGAQPKFSLRIEQGTPALTTANGTHILKPTPIVRFDNPIDMPANEHATMTIARQVFRIKTADAAVVEFQDGQPAYLTKRFDVTPEGRIPQEDFTQIAKVSEFSHGKNYKYEALSYEGMAKAMKSTVSAYMPEADRFLRLVLFNYLVQNGDAHAKNFSLQLDAEAGMRLTPAYDLLNSHIHLPNDARCALQLFDEHETESYAANGFYSSADFIDFGATIGINPKGIQRALKDILKGEAQMNDLLDRSFMSKVSKEKYKDIVADRRRAISMK